LDEMIIDLKNQEKLAFVADLIGKLSESGRSETEIRQMHEKANQLFTSYV
ncbi:ComE operon protein 2, partial [Bacillus altitudinis]|nr:ComE operon protein 2 [Bacillus altitudinis]